jgi:hypothetical protein
MFRFVEDALVFDASVNVAFGPTKMPTVKGRRRQGHSGSRASRTAG